MRFQIGIVGIGKIAQTYFKVLRRIPNVQITFLCDIIPEQMKKAEHAFPDLLADVPHFSSTDEAFDSGIKPDAVLIATPLNTHFMLSERVLRRGRRVLLEKPSVSTLDELAKLYALAQKHQTRYQTMFHFAYAPEVECFASLKPQIERRLGPLRAFACDFQDPAVSGTLLTISPRKLGGSYLSSGVNALSVLNRAVDLSQLQVVSHQCRQISGLIDRNNEKVVPEVDTSSITEYATNSSVPAFLPSKAQPSESNSIPTPLTGIIRTDWEQNWNFKSTLLIFQYGTVLLDHTTQSVVLNAFSPEGFTPKFREFPMEKIAEAISPNKTASQITFHCANQISRQEREYETMFRHHFFHPEVPELAQKQDFKIHELLLNPIPRN
ncbi:MAG: Gfo/Idh/MocA family oxidoreductase [Thermoguttaceae bacterium]|nr:Gfo/Idh/MocA family oxidoreductase [Thermoguttaceae bacterium]